MKNKNGATNQRANKRLILNGGAMYISIKKCVDLPSFRSNGGRPNESTVNERMAGWTARSMGITID